MNFNMNTTKHQTRDPQKLKPLPFVRTMMRWSPKSDEFLTFKADIKAHGIKHPIQIIERNGDNLVVDGWTRVLAARDWQFTEVPVEVVEESEALTIFNRELCLRRNITASQRAYFMVPLASQLFLEQARNHAKNHEKWLSTEFTEKDSCRRLAAVCGVNHQYINYAQRLHQIFDKHEDLKEAFEPKLLADEKPLGLGATLAGLGMFVVTTPGPDFNKRINRDQHTGGKTKLLERQMDLFCETFTHDASARWEYFTKFDTQHRKKVFETIAETAKEEQPEMCHAKAKFYEELAEIYKTAAKTKSAEPTN